MNKKTICSIVILVILLLCLYVVYTLGNRKSPSKTESQGNPSPTAASNVPTGATGAPTSAPVLTGEVVSITPTVTGEAVTGTVTPSVTPSLNPTQDVKPTPTIKAGENDLPPVVIVLPTPSPEPTDAPKPSGNASPTPAGNISPTPVPTNTPTKSVTPTPTVAPTKVPKGGNVGDDGVIRLPVIPAEDK